jgi:hypothetical protein
MALSGKHVEELVAIVRQHAIYFGGGISSDDAKVRDRCDGLISALEKEARASGSGARPAGRAGQAAGARSAGAKQAARPGKKSEAAAKGAGGRAAAAKSAARRKTPARAAREMPLPKPPSIPLKAGARAAAGVSKAAVKAGRGTAPARGRPVGRADLLAEAARKPARAGAAAGKQPSGKPPAAARGIPAGQAAPVRVPSGGGAQPAESRQRKLEAVHLFDAYTAGTLPKYGGYIISSSFDAASSYAVFDLVGYDNVQEIFLQSDALIFKSAGCRLYALVEPAGYAYKNVEPNQREDSRKIPYRFKELESFKTKKLDTVYVGKKPFISYSTFTVVKPQAGNFSILFYNVPTVFQNIQDFLVPVLNQRLGIPKPDAQRATKKILDGILTFRIWLDL